MRGPMTFAARFGAALLGAAMLVAPVTGRAAEEAPEPPDVHWSFEGIFGHFDRAQLQRGFIVYNQVCASCHSLDLVYYRNLLDIGISEAAAAEVAAQKMVQDGPDDQGDMFERAARLSDPFVAPFPNDQAARAAQGGALPPDLSLMAKARAGGPEYLHGILVGYDEPPAGVELPPGMYWNEYFPGHQIAMPPPLSEGAVEYPDETAATVEQMARDVTAFLQFAAEPHQEDRKRTGVKVILFLIVLTGLLYAVKRRIWADVH